ncbi:hypothetical protein [Micromonospora sp. NPDC004704]
MSTLTPDDPDAEERQRHQPDLSVMRLTFLMAGGALGVVVLLTALGGWGGTATAGLATVGAIVTAAFGVAALYIGRR